MLPKLTFVLGGAASGKSVFAEKLISSSGLNCNYLATSRVLDHEMKARVDLHKSRRQAGWTTFEQDLDLGPILAGLGPTDALLIDCATMWLSNHMLDGHDLEAAQSHLLIGLQNSTGPVVIVSNEVGHGIVPDNALARGFREEQGRLNIALAAQSNLAVLVTAGLPTVLKGTLP